MACAHGEKFGKKFGSEQRIISSPELGGARHETLVVNPQLLGDFGTGHYFLKSSVPLWVGGLGVEVSFDSGRGEGSEDESDNLTFDEIEVDGCRKTQMTLLGQVQELYVDLRKGNTIDYALGDISEVEGKVLRDEKSLLVRWGVVMMTGDRAVCEDVGIVFVTSVIECGCNFNPEG